MFCASRLSGFLFIKHNAQHVGHIIRSSFSKNTVEMPSDSCRLLPLLHNPSLFKISTLSSPTTRRFLRRSPATPKQRAIYTGYIIEWLLGTFWRVLAGNLSGINDCCIPLRGAPATVRTGSPLLLVLHGNELLEFLSFFFFSCRGKSQYLPFDQCVAHN